MERYIKKFNEKEKLKEDITLSSVGTDKEETADLSILTYYLFTDEPQVQFILRGFKNSCILDKEGVKLLINFLQKIIR